MVEKVGRVDYLDELRGFAMVVTIPYLRMIMFGKK